ncbi:DMT family transporter [Rhodobacteraceae bacterium RKSG542]|uniref:DMT family transporter n=1 Tax=Pseudovibrio flavus TaxID=2529854 RepID=UPI0012BD5F8B|nr:DMT family transporter [Pseudovibrio flavus]MTI17738.1 DMT family transporter [Pseudovibrio flavus]
MSGEALALLSAFFYGLAGVSIAKGKSTAKGDNGVFLSVVMTALLTLVLWLGWGNVSIPSLFTAENTGGLAFFVIAGLCASVLGRSAMYRATERIGALKASLFRRLIPVFAVPCAIILLDELPAPQAIIGGGVILIGVLAYMGAPRGCSQKSCAYGDMLGIASALFYASAYSFRSLGLQDIPDPALGTLIGAVVGVLWFAIAAALSAAPKAAIGRLLLDRGRWQYITALSLSFGQTLQFFALQSASVPTVAVLGALEVFFSAMLVAFVFKTETLRPIRFAVASALATLGTFIVFV